MSNVPDAWDDDYTNTADQTQPTDASSLATAPTKKQTKAQKRAAQAEFNRQLWAEAEGPKETNYFLESRNVVPLRSEFRPPPVLLSRKGPVIQKPVKVASRGEDGFFRQEDNAAVENAIVTATKEESSEDEDEIKRQELEREERKERAKREREEKQKKYEERRLELFGGANNTNLNGKDITRSGQSSPNSATPPGSRSQTPSRGRGGRGGGRRGTAGPGRGGAASQQQYQPQHQQRASQHELFDPTYTPKPDSVYIERRKNGEGRENKEDALEKPIRQSKGPDGSGRGGFGFVARGGKQVVAPAQGMT